MVGIFIVDELLGCLWLEVRNGLRWLLVTECDEDGDDLFSPEGKVEAILYHSPR
jgi:hypothetical protein